MTKMPPDPKEGYYYYYSIKTHKGMPFFGVLLSIFVYISIFYTFQLSPSNLFNNTKFWFLISNTLILIIAADYSVFSQNKHDVYEESVRRPGQPRITIASSFVPHYTSPKEDVEDSEEIKEVITSENAQLVPQSKLETQITCSSSTQDIEETKREKRIVEDKKYRRSNSESVKRVNSDASKNVMIRSYSATAEKPDESPRQEDGEEKEEEENEFSNMSNEELNRRVEEFIQRFNTQIRLQRRQSIGIE